MTTSGLQNLMEYTTGETHQEYLPLGPTTNTKLDEIYSHITREQNNGINTRTSVDSKYANSTTHRRSVTGISIKLAGGTIFYKTAFQPTVALSSS